MAGKARPPFGQKMRTFYIESQLYRLTFLFCATDAAF